MSVQDYAQLYQQAGQQYGVDPKLLMAQAQVESHGNPNAYNDDTDAEGIAQFIPDTAKRLGLTDPSDPKQAIPAQAKLMAENLHRYGNVADAVSAYHGGTDKSNWGPKTQAYQQTVLKNYQGTQMADNDNTDKNFLPSSSNSDDLDPFEGAKKDIAAKAQPTADADLDPFEGAKKDVETAKAAKASEKPQIGVGEDLGLTALSAPVKAIGALPQIPAMAGNAIANSMGYLYGKAVGVTPDQQEKLNSLNPFFTGNTPLDALDQSVKGIVTGDAGPQNPLTGSVLHDPATMPGRFLNAGVQAAVGGPIAGVKMAPSLMGAAGAQTASEAFPGNPLAPVVGGLVAGAGPSAASSVKVRATPEELASNVLRDNGGGPPPGGGGGLTAGNINPTEIIPGSKPTLAQVTGDPNIALMERQLQAKDPKAFADLEKSNEVARQAHFEKAAGTPQDIETMENDREARSTPLYQQAAKQQLDPTAIHPVLSKIDAAIQQVGDGSEAGKTLAAIKAKIQGALPSEIKDDKGRFTGQQKNPTQSPLVQIYREERDNLQKPSTAPGAYAATVKSTIQPIVHELGQAIEGQSPPFAQAQQIYRDASPKIDGARWMQNLKLTDSTGRFTQAKVNNALQNANRLRNSPGLNPAKNLNPNQMQTLNDLNSDLTRREGVARASMPRGSNTVQNALAEARTGTALGKASTFMEKHTPEMIGSGLGLGIGALTGHPWAASTIGDFAGRYLQGKSSARVEKATSAMKDFVLNPENYKNYLMNASKESYFDRLSNKLLTNP